MKKPDSELDAKTGIRPLRLISSWMLLRRVFGRKDPERRSTAEDAEVRRGRRNEETQ